MDQVFIEDLRVRGKHGCSEEERSRPQEFILAISASFDTSSAARTDDLADTLDYGAFRRAAREVIEGESRQLIETLAAAIAEKILKDERVTAVSVSIRKSEIYPDCTPGVHIERTRV